MKAGGPSLLPEFEILVGSSPGPSATLRYVSVPPGWASWRGAVVGVAPTLVMPPVTARDGAPVIVDFLAVVAVVLLAVVTVDPPATAAVVDVESPVTTCDVVLVVSADCSVDAVVELVSAADGFFGPEPPPQAAAIM